MSATDPEAKPAGLVEPGRRPRQRRPLPWVLCNGVAAGGLVVVAFLVVRGTLGNNFHTVIPGRVYRSAQPSGQWLEEIVHQYGIRTVINLRGNGAPLDWYLDECRATHRLQIAQEDLTFWANRLPSTDEIRRLVEVFDHSEYPVLVHCFRGADRTGLASTVATLLYTDATLNQACRHLGICYGHVPIGKCGQLERFFDLYREWLQQRHQQHSPEVFRLWLTEGYCPGECRCELSLVQPPTWVPADKAFTLTLRAHNNSIKPWRLCAASNAGIHAAFLVYDERNLEVAQGRAGLFDAEVAPGESIDLTLVVPPIKTAGHYRLMVDMLDEQHCSFSQTGSEPLEWELEVREQKPPCGG
jgi:protein tyrosine phosphatase (PTP) superfamily phosphohydrolase (DUF442 family)